MIKEREPILEKLSVAFQVFLTLGCFVGSLLITHTFFKPITWNLEQYKILLFILIPLWIILLEHAHLGRVGRLKMYSITFVEYFTVIVIGNILLYAAVEILKLNSVSRLVLGVFAVTNFIVLYSFKYILSATMKYIRRK